MKRERRVVLLLFLFALPALAGNSPPVVAVLSSQSGPYLEAFAAFQQELGRSVPVVPLEKDAPRLPPGTRTVVAFGGKAALAAYPSDVNLVYCLAPGVTV